MSTDTETRLERLTVALLQSDYVKSAFLEPMEIASMARLLELSMTQVSCLSLSQVTEVLKQSRLR